ncbi:hypothetical protein L1987_80848 [Smallanthus sonchifolius]|uniref:Uncharacterized protein n=1 Tax=Smallanthus sonchifolius TaxID=185202 RepID=A0ACB8YN65_9ASTR|nr:hypothetical protein L1987_80848 [Smallanthus sonchifolius]
MNTTSTGSGAVIPPAPINQQQQNHTIVPIVQPAVPPLNLPRLDLLEGPREDYFKVAVPLYEAAIKGDWKAAKPILDKQPDLIRFAITENYETLLHIAASAECTRSVEEFVMNLVELMDKEDLELQNKNSNTALSLAAIAGNVKTTMIMMKKNPSVIEIPGNNRMMLLYKAALLQKLIWCGICIMNLRKCWAIFGLMIIGARSYKNVSMLISLVWLRRLMHLKEVDHILSSESSSQFLQGPLLWFKEVERMIPPRYRQLKNVAGETPRDLFTKKHANLITKGEEWIKSTTSEWHQVYRPPAVRVV